jgi:hypothetical protein
MFLHTSASYAACRASNAARMLSRSPMHSSSSPVAPAPQTPKPCCWPPAKTPEPGRALMLEPRWLPAAAGPLKACRGMSRRTTRSRRLLAKSSQSFSKTRLCSKSQAAQQNTYTEGCRALMIQCALGACWPSRHKACQRKACGEKLRRNTYCEDHQALICKRRLLAKASQSFSVTCLCSE